jgi:Ca2+-binding RTX toxin-like protein
LRRILVVIAIATPAVLNMSAAHAAKADCFGKRATIVGTGQDDTLRGTRGDDVIVGGRGSDTISGRGGDDRICGSAGRDVIRGKGGADSIDGGAGIDKSAGNRGKDRIKPGHSVAYRGGPDRATGGPGADSLIGDLGVNSLRGGEGNDIIDGRGVVYDGCDCSTQFADLLVGGRGDDTIRGGRTAGGNAGGEILVGGQGDDVLNGGEDGDGSDGFDVVSYGSATGPVDIDLALGRATGQGSDSLTGIAGAFGSPFGDTVKGDVNENWLGGASGDDVVTGGEGNDTLGIGGRESVLALDVLLSRLPIFRFEIAGFDGGDDVLSGEGGDDVLVGSELAFDDMGGWTAEPGNDELLGGPGVDWVTFDCLCPPLDRSITVNLAVGTAEGWGTDSLDDIENMVGSLDADVLTGDDDPNEILGMQGDDSLSGLGGDDTLDGGIGFGVPGNNTNDGGAGTDYCVYPDTASGAVNCENP